ncbi:MAG: hypothetical protein IPL87_04795 [Candidatus Moraniibacteriota bacterium]|nr:MAG: hypothetical protein IPL87_04795 [Candidatus Moranbacteria bacterium]
MKEDLKVEIKTLKDFFLNIHFMSIENSQEFPSFEKHKREEVNQEALEAVCEKIVEKF